uniref:Dihydrodipicolinate synthase/N-acetylneuraminate lyase n=1 Tax=Candidatus Kentrum eta TaxID=2126337 RepID=A0A450V8R5_9GAMM|nr:MAG: Dihydrodipicolinate synthase/N-acetylneuraminate lyase [Candidatus Kentron sp. H]VFK01087.1 MAG: Dihydrodipicolinate synthase/N-acetylneuraminate lyase [Candidatus Kentron sp. H]VFK04899.1 MAG: Dihydrodipicolinate synthase/N-acetylneuraminate lyase [Candidatus Kentron sp. H]
MKSANDLIADPIVHYPKATVACFDPTTGELPRRPLDEERNVRFLEKLAGNGVPAVLIAASSGQGHLRTGEELAQWFRSAAMAKLGATIKTALLRPEDGVEANTRLIALLETLDYPVIFVRPGTDLPPGASPDAVYRNIRPIVEESAAHGLAVGLYSIPDVSGLPLSPEAAAMLVDGPGGERIVAIKVTEADYEASTLPFLEHPGLEHLAIVQGWDPHLVRALRDGPEHDSHGRQRCGITSGPMSFAVYQYLHILERAQQGDWDEVLAAQSALTALFRSVQDDPNKFPDLQRVKYLMGLGHPINGTVSEEQVARFFAALVGLPRDADRVRLARSLDIMGDGPYHQRLRGLIS